MPTGLTQNLKESPIKTVGTAVALVGAVLTLIWGVNANMVFKDDIVNLEHKIVEVIEKESASIRIVYIHDLETRLEDVEVEIEELLEAKKDVPSTLRRSARRLTNRIQEISGGR